MKRLSSKGKLWVYAAESAAWHFVHIERRVSEEIKKQKTHRVAFGSVRVEARIGKSVWRTSVFPDAKSGTYVLPIKKDIRQKEGLTEGGIVEVFLTIV